MLRLSLERFLHPVLQRVLERHGLQKLLRVNLHGPVPIRGDDADEPKRLVTVVPQLVRVPGRGVRRVTDVHRVHVRS